MSGVRATYRLQFRQGMDFEAAAGTADYLAELGMSHLYASPVFAAAPGSTHGYDIIDCNRIEPGLGGMDGLRTLVAALRGNRLGLILDIVPNHMAARYENRWWRAALAEGPDGPHGATFDINWERGGGKVTLPLLGAPLEEVLEGRQITLREQDGETVLAYFDHCLPLNCEAADALEAALADPSPTHLARLLDAQHYRLIDWRQGPQEINYRRFFEIDGLVALRMEDEAVFGRAHRLLLDLVSDGLVDGVRVDHVDGLADPRTYLERLAGALAHSAGGREVPVWVEKILGPEERLPHGWPVAGTTGYEFGSDVTRLQTDADGLAALEAAYHAFIGTDEEFDDIAARAKRRTLASSFPNALAELTEIAQQCLPPGHPVTPAGLERGLRDLLVAFPVYRSYVADGMPGFADYRLFAEALAGLKERHDAPREAIDALGEILSGEHGDCQEFFTRLQQLSSALTAKAIEDTGFYQYAAYLPFNEVGSSPEQGVLSVAAFHQANLERAAHWPDSLLATATHDTKRGEDVRARLAMLSADPHAFIEAVRAWRQGHEEAWKAQGDGAGPLPRPKDLWLFYQTVTGIWPPGLGAEDGDGLAELAARMRAYMLKAAREAKERTSWTDPDPAYEERLTRFAGWALDPRACPRTLHAMAAFITALTPAGAAGSIVQTVLKITAPGIPDIYQGTEGWDLSLVDPDNRRPVDFDALRKGLHMDLHPGARPDAPDSDAGTEAAHIFVKQRIIQRGLHLRADHIQLFAQGSYVPLEVEGPLAGMLVAFARRHEESALVTLAARLCAWRDARALEATTVILPAPLDAMTWHDILGTSVHVPADRHAARRLLHGLPACILFAAQPPPELQA